MEPVRILQVVTVMNRGGLETMLMNYYRQMDRADIQFDFMVHRLERGHYDDEIESMGGVIYRMPPIKPGNYRLYFNKLTEFFHAHHEYRVVHSHINENSSFVLREAKRAGIPCRIAHSHLSDLRLDLKFPFRVYAKYVMKDNPNRYFACSKKAGRWLFGREIEERNSLVVMNNAVNLREFAFDPAVREKVRSEFQAGERLVIGHVGRFNEQKNHSFLIDIFHSVYQRNRNVLLVLVGEGYLEPAIRQKVEQLGLKDHVAFLGVRSDIPRLMQGMDLFLFPSLFEGLPVVLVEAQAAGLRCIASSSITPESDLTGRVRFISLQEPADLWAREILDSSCERADTSEQLRESGYDSAKTAEWLASFYHTECQPILNQR
ncbi:glycosyltransferase family 1 protein [Paenibacillus sp. URB8-2]|uniref:glycosyltransferase family 1 protein n=1 Tax=Paenibacillus sp. URB8-2 TaxID=2741301 RepID=UPI0015B7A49E|nr:glycosyltransferase family 1 protein [Paenibacillus sp. URB8-2]BCG57421.1 putative glycosyltransferase EpsF [Paenibacillus sp. URB8-2]